MRAALALAVVVCGAAAARAATPEARQIYAPLWRTSAVPTGPCLLTLVLPPTEAEHCASWTRRESAGAAFHTKLGIAVVGGSDHRLRSLDIKSGALRWTVETPGSVMATPALADDAVYVGTDDGHVLRLDATSGRVRFDVSVDAEVNEPVVVDGDLILVVTGADSLYALRAATGEPAWVHKHPLPRAITLRGQAKPAVVEVVGEGGATQRRVLVGHASGRLSILERDTGRVIDEIGLSGDDSFGDLDADPFVQQGKVVVASQTRGIFALDAKSNQEVWKNPEAGIVRLARGGRHMVVAAGAGKVVGLDAVSGQTRWRFTFDKGAPTRIVVHGGRVHVGSDRGSLYILDLFSGRPLQYIGDGLGVAADPTIGDDILLVTTTAGDVIALSSAFRGLVAAKR